MHCKTKNEILEHLDKGIIRQAEYHEEYNQLIERIRIFSDFWISSAAIYSNEGEEKTTLHYVALLINMFYPYLTEKGKENYFEIN